MAGFPTRTSRDALGPELEDERPVRDPKRELGAEAMTLAWWQMAGLSQCAPLAVIRAAVAGSAVATNAQGLAWDPNGALPFLTWTYNSAGRYGFTFSTSYPNESGVSTPLQLLGGFAQAEGVLGAVVMASDYSGEVRFDDTAGTPTDPSQFMLLLF